MSVINQMLKDLGARQSRSELRLSDMLERQAASSRSRNRPVAGPALLVLAGGLVLGLLLWQQRRGDEAMSTAAPDVAAPQPAPAPAVISAVGIEADAASLRLVFETDRAPADPVSGITDKDGSIEYLFTGARIEAASPVLAQNPFIKSYSVIQRGTDVVVRVTPAAAATAFVESAAAESGAHRTVIGVRAPARAATPRVATAAPDKKTATDKTVTRPAAASNSPAKSEPAETLEITRRTSPAQQAEAYYRQGLDKLQADRVEAAVSDLRQAVRLQPGLHAARELLAALLLRGGQVAEAHAALQEGMQLDPAHTPYARLYAQSLTEAGDPAAALRVLAVSEPYATQQPDYRALMAAVAQRLALHEESVRHYMAALALKPARSAWWVGMAISLEALGRGHEAAQAYRTALAGSELNADLMDYARARVTQLGG